MRTPGFWNGRPRLLSFLFSPLSWIWAAKTRHRLRQPSIYAGIPVICVGNLTAGGTGKTPVVIALLERCRALEINAHVVSRGYGGREVGPTRVNERFHKASDVGDEPLLLAAFGPTWVARDRAAGATAARKAGAEMIILDDGFQNPTLHKDISFIVVDADVGFGNGKIIPAGPLRESPADGFKRADAIIAIGSKGARAHFASTLVTDLPLLGAEMRPLATGMDWNGLKALAFAGIGRPEKFFTSLRQAGVDIVSTRAFGDHAPYRRDMLNRLKKEAKAKGAQLVTTEKDATRLPLDFRAEVLAFPVRLKMDQPEALDRLIRKSIAISTSHPEAL